MKRLYTMIRSVAALGALLGAGCAGAQSMASAPASAAAPTSASIHLEIPGLPSGPPVATQTLSPAALTTLLQTRSPLLLQLAGTPKCTISISSLGYYTVDGRGKPTTAATAVMQPSGPGCTGSHPVALYAHGTSADRNYDLTNLNGDINGDDDALTAAAIFAAQGYDVVLPNYAGYAGSSLNYAPFLNANQQAADMINALRAARLAFPSILLDGLLNKLFVTGYSQGGYVAMATYRAMQPLTLEFHPVALATGNGPYALSHMADEEIDGRPSGGSPVLFDLVVNSWQQSYGNVYPSPTEVFAPQYAATAPGLLPGTVPETTLFAENAIPATALFQTGSLPGPNLTDPDTAVVVQAGFASANFFLNTSFREHLVADVAANPCSNPTTGQPIANCAPTTGFRQDALRNDLLNFKPAVPLQMCGAHSDSTVYFDNTQIAAQFFEQEGVPASRLTVVDVDPGNAAPAGPFAALQAAFAAARAQVAAELGNSPTGQLELSEDIHDLAEAPCVVAARTFFQGMMK